MQSRANHNPVVAELVQALSEPTGCAGLACAETGYLLTGAGDEAAALRAACSGVVRRAADDGRPGQVHLADGAGLPGGLRLLAVEPIGGTAGGRLVLFAAATARGIPSAGVAVLMRSVAAVLRRQFEQLAPTPQAGARGGARPVALMIADAGVADAPLAWVSRAFCRMTGYSPGEAIGRNARLLQGGDRDQAGRWRLGGALGRGTSCTVDLRNYRRDGTRFAARVAVTPVRGADDRVSHYAGVLHDRTGRAPAGPPPVASDAAVFIHSLEMSPVGKVVVDARSGRARFANPVAARLFGCRPAALIGREMGPLPMADGPVRLPGSDGAATGQPAEMTVKPIHWGRHPALLVTLFDVVERSCPDASPAGIDEALERYPYPVVSSRPDGSVAWVSQGTADLLARSRDELMALSTGALDAGGLVDGEAWARNWAFVRLQRTVTLETRLRRRDGWTVPAVLDVQHVERDGAETHVVFIRNASVE